MSLVAALSGLKRASEVVAALIRGDVTLEKAELKVKLADVLGELADARTAVIQAREELKDNEREMDRLRDAVRLREEVVRTGDAYFRKDASGSPSGAPFCSYCIEKDGRFFHLTDHAANRTRVCPHCKNAVEMRRSFLSNGPPPQG
jgi:hypothetical protein